MPGSLRCALLGVLRGPKKIRAPGQDYHSLQIASSTELKGLQSLYEQHRHLPFLRLEKRGNQFTLRAGFWHSIEEARRALSGRTIPGAQLRIAVLRPELLLQTNWTSNAPVAQDAPPQVAEPLLRETRYTRAPFLAISLACPACPTGSRQGAGEHHTQGR